MKLAIQAIRKQKHKRLEYCLAMFQYKKVCLPTGCVASAPLASAVKEFEYALATLLDGNDHTGTLNPEP